MSPMVTCAVFLAVAAAMGAEAPVIVAPSYADDAAARAAWLPMAGSRPVEQVKLPDGPALRLPVNFAGTTIERASWDLQANLDLTTSRGITFQVRCADPSPMSYCSLYFQSGAGWYHTEWFPEGGDGWSTITINKSAMGSEGEPAGWGKITAIRFSVWRGEARDTELYLRQVARAGVAGVDTNVVVIRSEGDGVGFANTMADKLVAAGIDSVMVSAAEVTPELLKPYAVAILPYNPTLPEPAIAALEGFVAGGGKLLACYGFPAPLAQAVGIEITDFKREERPGQFAAIAVRPGELPGAPAVVKQASWNVNVAKAGGQAKVVADWLDDKAQPNGYGAIVETPQALWLTHVLLNDGGEAKARLLLAMVGRLSPKVWRGAAQAAVARAARVSRYASFEEATAALVKDGAPANVLDGARREWEAAQTLLAAGKYPEAFDQAGRAAEAATRAWCADQQPTAVGTAQKSKPGEFRAFWCHSASGVSGMSWDQAAELLAKNGFTAVLPNMLWGGVTFGRSDILPQASATRDDIADCLAACRKHGLKVHVWKVNWNTGWSVPKEFLDKMAADGRLQMDAKGQVEPWLCPSHPANQKLEIDSMVEVARRYAVDGLHFDYIRYPDNNHCFCPGCRERFAKSAGDALADWPAAALPGGRLRAAWLDWRRSNITTVVKGVSEGARAVRPGIKLSAAVFSNWAVDRDGVGQDWKLWCDKGWLDFVCPMDYTTSNYRFGGEVVRQIGWAGKVPVYPGIGASATGIAMTPEQVIEQIKIAREKGAGGFTIFNYGASEAANLVPMLGLGITKR